MSRKGCLREMEAGRYGSWYRRGAKGGMSMKSREGLKARARISATLLDRCVWVETEDEDAEVEVAELEVAEEVGGALLGPADDVPAAPAELPAAEGRRIE